MRRSREVDVKAAGSVLTLVLILIGLSVAGGCNSDREVAETFGGVPLQAEAAEVTQPTNSDPGAGRPGAVAFRPGEADLDPFALLPFGLAIDGYSSDCELIDDPYADCL